MKELEDAQLQPGPQGDLFVQAEDTSGETTDALLAALRALDPDELSPKEALAKLYELTALARR